jgi:hypothetical protein
MSVHYDEYHELILKKKPGIMRKGKRLNKS